MDNNKSSNNKTINFAEKKRAIDNKKNQVNGQKNVKNDNRVIKYDINKMREQINQKTRTKNISYSRSSWVKYVYIFAIALFSILLVAKIFTTVVSKDNKNPLPSKFVSQSTIVDTTEADEYNKIINKYLNTYIKSDGKLTIETTSIHRNDNYIYLSGYFSYPNDNSKISFDAIIIGKDKVNSLVVNGYDLIKQ